MELIGIAQQVYESKYKDKDDECIEDTWFRVASAIAVVDPPEFMQSWIRAYYRMLENFKVLPGGRITAGAGTKHPFLLNCCVEPISDSIEGIYDAVKRAAVLAKSNYGTGFDFSPLRPKNSGLSVGGVASGPVSFMRIFDTSGSVIETGGGRRAASIGVLRVDHPDIFEFIDAKRQEGVLTQFNISVAITKKFMDAVRANADFDLVFEGQVYETVKAKAIWDKLIESGFMYNDPGILFIDEVNRTNNGHYMYSIAATNPCGEIPLPPHGVCDLGSINLTQFITYPFTKAAMFDSESFKDHIRVLVRFLDNVLDVSEYPFPENKERAQGDRRLGLCGVAGLGSALAMLQIPYDSQEGLEFAEAVSIITRDEAYRASIELAKERGPFPNFIRDEYMKGEFIKSLPEDIQWGIYTYGIRNIALLTVPPVGTGSILAGNISNGLEPIFALEYTRHVRQVDGSKKPELVEDYAWGLWKNLNMITEIDKSFIPGYFKTAMEISPVDHIKMQAVIQKYIDGSISKTANLPANYTKEDYIDLLWLAYESGLKGFTTFREGSREAVLVVNAPAVAPIAAVAEPKSIAPITSRPRRLKGETFQIKEEGNHRTYCTLNYIEEDGIKKPWEVFLSSSSRHSEWYAAIGRLASRIMRKTGDVQAVIDELMEIGSDAGYLTQEYGYVTSKPMHIAKIIEEFVAGLNEPSSDPAGPVFGTCPQCGETAYRKEGGCSKCDECGFSTCG
jgi:ribonucleoside-diphosphate reductase alpha chain